VYERERAEPHRRSGSERPRRAVLRCDLVEAARLRLIPERAIRAAVVVQRRKEVGRRVRALRLGRALRREGRALEIPVDGAGADALGDAQHGAPAAHEEVALGGFRGVQDRVRRDLRFVHRRNRPRLDAQVRP